MTELYVCDTNGDVSGPFVSYTSAHDFIADESTSSCENTRRAFSGARVLTAEEFERQYGEGSNPLRYYPEKGAP